MTTPATATTIAMAKAILGGGTGSPVRSAVSTRRHRRGLVRDGTRENQRDPDELSGAADIESSRRRSTATPDAIRPSEVRIQAR